MSEAHARSIAEGKLNVEDVDLAAPVRRKLTKQIERHEADVARMPVVDNGRHVQTNDEEDPMSKEDVDRIEKQISRLTEAVAALAKPHHPPAAHAGAGANAGANAGAPPLANGDEEALYQRFKQRLSEEAPAILKLLTHSPELEVVVQRKTVSVDSSSVKGRVGKLIAGGWFKEPRTFSAVRGELKRTGPDINNKTLANAFADYVADGFLTEESDNTFLEVAGMKRRLKEVESQ
jgi:hypothetical protein